MEAPASLRRPAATFAPHPAWQGGCSWVSSLREDLPGWAQTTEVSCPILSGPAPHVGKMGQSSKEVGPGPG